MASDTLLINTDAERAIAIWLDAAVNVSEENQRAQEQIRTIMNSLETFDNRNECGNYIRSLSSQVRLLLIVSGRLGRQLVPDIHNLPQVTSVYVYCQDTKPNENWARHYTKIKGVTNRLDELISQIQADRVYELLVNRIQILNTSVEPVTTILPSIQRDLPLIFVPYLSNVLLRIKPSENDKKNFISLCKVIYKDSPTELNNIEAFERTYNNNKALWWFTHESCFMFHIFKEALRTLHLDTIFLLQFYICDLLKQLTENQCQDRIKVYRGRLMSESELDERKASIGGFYFPNALVLASIDRDPVVNFLNQLSNLNSLQKALYEIDADPSLVTTKPFADTKKHGFPSFKHEILFALGSIFRIESVHQSEDQIWNIKMTLCGDNDPDLQIFLNEMMQKYGSTDGDAVLFSFSRILRSANRFDAADKYCHRLLEQFSSDETSLCLVYDELAEIANSRGDRDSRDQWLQKSNELKKKNDPSSPDTNIASLFNDNDNQESLNETNISHSILENTPSSDTTSIQNEPHNKLRFIDLANEKHDDLLPIEGHEKMSLVSLEEAIKPVETILSNIWPKVHTAKLRCKTPDDGLTPDESAAIMLYTMQWEPKEQCLFFALNERLRTAERDILKPWFLYLKLILTALSRLPSIQRTVYRGVKLDLSSEHKESAKFFWWGFSSCTTTMKVLTSKQFLGDSGNRTLFLIDCTNGKDIQRHSYYGKEEEILLLPATYLEVKSCFQMAPGLQVIQLNEIKPDFPRLEPIV